MDVQGFCDNDNGFVVKECAVVAVGQPYIQHWIVRPPHEFQKLTKVKRVTASWVKTSHLGIGWSEGCVDFEEFVTELRKACSSVRKIYVKGVSKMEFITRIVDTEVIDLTDHGAPSLKILMHGSRASVLRCLRHSDNLEHVCALSIADKLRYWISSNSHVFS